jgi:hypothetical protein
VRTYRRTLNPAAPTRSQPGIRRKNAHHSLQIVNNRIIGHTNAVSSCGLDISVGSPAEDFDEFCCLTDAVGVLSLSVSVALAGVLSGRAEDGMFRSL